MQIRASSGRQSNGLSKGATGRGRRSTVMVLAGLVVVAPTRLPGGAPRWGEVGHTIAGRAAGSMMPAAMPAFFRQSADQLGWLNFEPDRWRADRLTESNEAFRYDHYIDLEVVPAAARTARDRFEYLRTLQQSGIQRPARDAGLLPFRITEMHQRLMIGFANWRKATDPRERAWLEQRIVNDAGILGHYATDAANPHHTTIHHNGWARNAPNPNGYTTERTFHGRFEAEFVGSHMTFDALVVRLGPDVRRIPDVRAGVWAFIDESHGQLDRLYQLEKQERFDANTRGAAHEEFALARLTAGADFLRALWWTAWLDSESL